MRPAKIFLFSANTSLVRPVSSCLVEAGYKVVIVSDGIGGMDLIQIEKPDLIILDHDPSGFSSLGIIRSLRAE